MTVIDKFHRMEVKHSLFKLGDLDDLPVWDILRYNIYLKYYYPEKDRLKFEMKSTRTFQDFIIFIKRCIISFVLLLTRRGENVVFTSSRYCNENGQYFDISAQAIIETLKSNCFIVEPCLKRKIKNVFFYDFSNILRRFYKKNILDSGDFKNIQNALEDEFGKCLITYKEANQLLLNFNSDFAFYYCLFKIKSTKKIFISLGNPKALIAVSKKLKIVSHLIQHASIEFDSIDLSYPNYVNKDYRILFPDYILTYGDYWCKNIKGPTKEIISIGNDYFNRKYLVETDNSILIISTIIHGTELKFLVKEMAEMRKDLIFIYKLHPNEFNFFQEYRNFFIDLMNVKVIADEIDTSNLIAKSRLVILIVSTVLYEALNQNKKVAVYKKINYERQLHLLGLKNLYFFSDVNEVFDIYSKESFVEDLKFYENSNWNNIKRVLEINFDK